MSLSYRPLASFIAILIGFAFTAIYGQSYELYEKHLFIENNDTLPYRMLFPKDYKVDKSYPLIIFLHGSGERGNDNSLQLKHGASFFQADSIRNKYPAFVVFPQCETGESWNNAEYSSEGTDQTVTFPTRHKENVQLDRVENLIKSLHKKFSIDKQRIYVGGLSMGGMGTFELVSRNPRMFAAAFAICGGAHPNTARRLKRTSWWIFHGLNDDIIPAKASENIYDALKNRSADVRISLYENIGHESWTRAFEEPGLMSWLFSKSKGQNPR